MANPATVQRIVDCGVIAVVRAPSGQLLVDVAEALRRGGVVAVEITFTVPMAHRVLEQVAERLGGQIILGAGTVLDPETARVAFLAGAEFVVGPTLNLRVIEMAARYGKAVIPGAFTPTEILTAWEAGADIVKVFPADVGGAAYLKAIHGPLPQVRLLPTGGVNLQTAGDFLRAGACALGVGGALVEKSAIASGNMERIESLARQYVQIVRKTREEMQAG